MSILWYNLSTLHNNKKEGIIMLDAKEIAKYFLSKDKEKKLFNTNVMVLNGRRCYEGNVRLDKYLYFAQTVYLAKYGELLFHENILAYDNGPIVKEVLEKYAVIQGSKNSEISLDENIKVFLDKIYEALEQATCEELVEISHEDTAWKELSSDTFHAPVIDIMKYQEKYKKQYKGLIKVMEI